MRISFVETMRGTVRDEDGGEHPLDFELKADAGARDFLRDGRTRATGLVHASPWVGEAPFEGTLELAPLAGRIRYELAFVAYDGRRLTLAGEKHVLLRDPVRTMTVLPITLRDADGALLAEGVVKFDLRDLAPFAASWLPFRQLAQKRLDVRRRAVERRLIEGL